MNSIITVLITYNQILLVQIYQLLVFIAKNIPLSSSKYDITNAKYKKLTVDKLPIIKAFKKLDYKQLLSEYKASNHGKDLKPIKSRGKNPVSPDTICPCCGAPHIYLYDNTGGRDQLLCKVCKLRFNKYKEDFKIGALVCPYCGFILVKKKDRKHFNIHKCFNRKCPFYIQSLKNFSPQEFEEFNKDKSKFKLHYIYREFTFDFFKVDLSSMPKGAVNFTFRRFYPHIMGLLVLNSDLSIKYVYSAMFAQRRHDINGTAKGPPLKIGNDYRLAEYIENEIKDKNIYKKVLMITR